ncbi:hypothetical protein C8R45DRAFT_1034332 [Mycena sanguinolenta]|nr:hypothetical protein C8R45DRAFT_1034332 [Mycena sanguinolenta]
MACMPTHRNCVMSAAEAPVILGRICSSWRAISIHRPGCGPAFISSRTLSKFGSKISASDFPLRWSQLGGA